MILGDTWGARPAEVEDLNGDGVIEDSERNERKGSIRHTIEPLYPLMRESIEPRSGKHPATGIDLVPPGTSPVGHPVNGAERAIAARNDLQYACRFDLGRFGPVDCSLPNNALGCDCNEAPENPLCWNGTSYSTMQYRAKGYPGRRQLAVLKGMGTRAVVASVCPANTVDESAADFGYRPAINAIVDRFKPHIGKACFRPVLAIGVDGSVPCVVLEATKGRADGSCPPCDGVRREPTAVQLSLIQEREEYQGNAMSCVCQVRQAIGDVFEACVTDPGAEG